MSRIAKRYAKALFNLTATDMAKAKQYRESLLGLKELFELRESARVLVSPVMPLDLKKSLLDYGLAQSGASDELKHLIYSIIDAGRVDSLPKVADAYAALIDAAEGKVHAEVTSAKPLSNEDSQQIGAALSSLLHKQVDVKPLIDSSLLGGFVVRVGQYLVDLSLKTKLDELAKIAVQDTFVKGRPS